MTLKARCLLEHNIFGLAGPIRTNILGLSNQKHIYLQRRSILATQTHIEQDRMRIHLQTTRFDTHGTSFKMSVDYI